MSAATEPLQGTCVWSGDDLAADHRWRYQFDDSDLAEIDSGLAATKGRPWTDLSREDFPLPGLAGKLTQISEDLENGRGLALVSGLPVEKYDEADRRRLWMGLGLHLGIPVYQDCDGLMMRDIEDAREDTDAKLDHRLTARDGQAFTSSKARTLSSGPLRFHTDRTDVVGLLCVRPARDGGVSRVASTAAIHNEILRRRPDLLDILYAPIPRSRLGEEKGGEGMHYMLPVFGVRDGKLTSHYSRTYVEAAQEQPGVPALTDTQWEAIDLLHEVAEHLAMDMVLKPGDMQFINNHAVYHARTAFEDPGDGPGRLLHRLWLAVPNSRPLPADHAVLWGNTDAGAVRGGIGQS